MNRDFLQSLHGKPVQAAEFLGAPEDTLNAGTLGIEGAGSDLNLPGRVLFDDRDARPGVKFADAELLGIPHRLVISDRGLKAGELEYRHRRDSDSRMLKRDAALELLRESSLS